jgi:hypothetical protein
MRFRSRIHNTVLIDNGFLLCAVAEGALDEVVLPVVNPVNPPPLEFSPESNYSRYFSSLLPLAIGSV